MHSRAVRMLKQVAPVVLVALTALAIRARMKNIATFTKSNRERRPVGEDGIVLGADSIQLEGSEEKAALLIHGFGDTPQSMRYLAEALNAAGWTVHVMLLPGHGRPLAQYATTGADEWLNAVRTRYAEMRAEHETVVVCGISMGGALAAILAAEQPEIPSVVLLAPYFVMPQNVYRQMLVGNVVAFPIPYHTNTGSDLSIHDPEARAKTVGIGIVSTRLLGQLRRVAKLARQLLPSLQPRVLYLQSREDNRLNAHDAKEQFARIGSRHKEQRWLTGCGHIITVDYCRDEVARQVIEWFAPQLATATSHHILES